MRESTPLTVNGREHVFPLSADRSLLSVLRDVLGLTGAKPGCGEGECGACTVLVDGDPVRSCTAAVRDVAGRSVTTVEGLSPDGRLHPVAVAFLEEDALQCGFCTSGMVVSAAALLARDPNPDEAAIREAMNGNVCRCGGYHGILRAVARAAELARGMDGGFRVAGELRAAAPQAGWMPRPPVPWDLQEPAKRDYFGTLGAGLVVVLPAEEVARNRPGEPGPWRANGGAWVHVGANEVATAFTGKVDLGQDNRTALTIIVAEELGMPFAAVRLVVGDTDVCPYDVGTFGSRSIPDAGDYLRAAAAQARQLLAEMASRELRMEARELVVSGCRVRARSGEPSIGFAELLHGVHRVGMATIGPASGPAAGPATGQVPASEGPGSWATGGGVPKPAAREAVAGERRYLADMDRPNMLHGKVLRAPAFGSTLRSLDLSAAEAMPGVTVLREGAFVGVAAPSLPAAVRAVEAIRAEWDHAAQPSEPGIVEYLRSHPVPGLGWEGPVREESGDVESALATSAVRLDATYTAAYIAHVPLETRGAIAEWDGDRLTVWTGTQRPFGVRAQLAGELGMPQERIRVIVPDTGGGWGGKHTGDAAVEAARLARAAGRPVKVRWSREDETTWAYFRPFAVIDVRSGAAGDGRLAAWDFTNIDSGPNALETPYEVAHRRVAYRPAASPLRAGSYRALAATANNFARESHMDELAHRLGADPLEFRLRHLRDDRLAAVLRAAAERAGWGRPLEAGRGLGLACGREKWARIATVADVRVHEDGRLQLLRVVTAYECGRVVDRPGLVKQVEGATVMGLGGALFEAVHFEDGRILNAKLSQYRVPRFADVPPIEVMLIDRPDIPSAGGGEVPIIAIAPAIANALFAATGRRIRDMPLVPDGVVR